MTKGAIDPAALGHKSVRPSDVVVGDHDRPRLAATDQNVIKIWPASPDWHSMSQTTDEPDVLRNKVGRP